MVLRAFAPKQDRSSNQASIAPASINVYPDDEGLPFTIVTSTQFCWPMPYSKLITSMCLTLRGVGGQVFDRHKSTRSKGRIHSKIVHPDLVEGHVCDEWLHMAKRRTSFLKQLYLTRGEDRPDEQVNEG